MKSLRVISHLTVPVLLLTSSTVFAQSKNNQQLTDDLARLQQGVEQIQSDMQGLRRLLDNRAMLELFQRMDELSQEASQLRGMLEQQDHDLAGIKKRQRELYLDIDRRLRELEMTSTRAPATTVPQTTAPSTSVTPEQTTPSATLTPPSMPATAAPPVAPANPVSGVAKPATISTANNRPPVSDERAAYQKAFDMLKEGRYKMANTAFKDFIEQYPQSNYAGNSQYWLGESNYVTRQFEQAVIEFNAVLKNYPSSNKVPDAMLKLGYTYYELSRFDEARQILDQLRTRYPSSTATRLAGKRLERMSREGR